MLVIDTLQSALASLNRMIGVITVAVADTAHEQPTRQDAARAVQLQELIHLYQKHLRQTKQLNKLLARAAWEHRDNPRPAAGSLPRKTAHKLTDEEISTMVAEYLAGATTRALGHRYGVNKSTVAQHVKAAGHQMRREGITTEQAAEALTLFCKGQTTKQLVGLPRDCGELRRHECLS